MYYDQKIIRKYLETHLCTKFDLNLSHNVQLLIHKLWDKDSYINNNLYINLQNILPLTYTEASKFITLGLQLSEISEFIPVLLLEKIPTLSFYGITNEILLFLTNIKDYGARATSLFLGSDLLKTEDLLDVLEQTTTSFYITLLGEVNQQHERFGVCSSTIMRHAAKIEKFISTDQISAYLDICAVIIKNYGFKIAERYIRNAHKIVEFVPLIETDKILADLAQNTYIILEFAVTYPCIFFGATNHLAPTYRNIETQPSNQNDRLKKLKINILSTENYISAFNHPDILDDSYFTALLLTWPNFNSELKKNILFQLSQKNFKIYMENHADIVPELDFIQRITKSNWLKPWTFQTSIVDLFFIRNCIGKFLQKQEKFTISTKLIIKNNSTLFDRKNIIYDKKRLINMIDILLKYCLDQTMQAELAALSEFMVENRQPLLDILSKQALVIQTWARDPWTDYGRSDEFFSCTSLGDYNVGNAPAFLADLNLNNLDIWSNKKRVGRIHLCLIKNISNETLLLLDCVDGSERIIGSAKKFEQIMESVLNYARWLGIKAIKINYDVDYNATPKKFISYVQRRFQAQNNIDFMERLLPISTTRKLMSYPCQTFTESFLKYNGALIRGPIIELQDEDQK